MTHSMTTSSFASSLRFAMACMAFATGCWWVGFLWGVLSGVARLMEWRAENRQWKAWLTHLDEVCEGKSKRAGQ